jgi:hypothetical protein
MFNTVWLLAIVATFISAAWLDDSTLALAGIGWAILYLADKVRELKE